ncbi:MAG: VCBS repeat-containing protein [Allomuricauda sp.]
MVAPKKIIVILALLAAFGCGDKGVRKKTTDAKTLFTLVPKNQSHVDFNNTITQDLEFNGLNYAYAYNGGGVSIGDVDNDGLEDIYFVSNQQSNKLYLNQGELKFKDVTEKAGVSDAGGWSTGSTMVDVNGDGWLDIYVCKSASLQNEGLRRNKLFINQKDGSFKEEAKKWGLDDNGFSIQSYFFDYDKDGDLDMFLVNHRNDFVNANAIEDRTNRKYFSETSSHLFRNDGTKFTDVTQKAGMMNREYSLSASIGDYNNDGWMDVYIANDFITPDHLYINNKNGTFSNQINTLLRHTSYSSMGSDYADINNDLLPDLLVLDMSAEDHRRGKQNMPSMNTQGFWRMVSEGYHYSYMSNILNLNRGNSTFTDVAQIAGVSKTDWSWAPLIADFDNDGYKDIFVTNGIQHELGNQDYKRILREKAELKGGAPLTLDEALGTMPSEKLMNYAFRNNGELTFSKAMQEWGLLKRVNSNGVAYGDLDNDGDLDLVLNNLDDDAIIYENNSTGNYINIKLIGDEKNPFAVGARVKVYTDMTSQYQELYPSRGYQSSVGYTLNFGLGNEAKINRIEVIWGDNTVLAQDNVNANQTLTFNKKDFKFDGQIQKPTPNYFKSVDPKSLGIAYSHVENEFNDFSKQVLLPQKQSQKGPTLQVADVNKDGLDDFFVGGALNQAAEMYLQQGNGTFIQISQTIFERDKGHEDNGALFFDADNDGDLDLYVASGGYELAENDPLFQDRLYLNDGAGNYTKGSGLPRMLQNTKSVAALDIDQDNDLDLIVGGHVVPGKYPLAEKSRVLRNNGGRFEDVTETMAPEFIEMGIVNDLLASDFDKDGDMDLIIAGEWMPITFMENTGNGLRRYAPESFKNSSGWWNTIAEIDIDQDGDMDYLAGNLGDNNKFHPSVDKPLHIYGNNFDDDGAYDMILSKIYNGTLVPVRGKECSTEQNPFVSEKIGSYKEFANSSLVDIYGESQINASYHKEADTFGSALILNNGDGTFTTKELPSNAQLGPTMAFVTTDINGDGYIDVLGAGGIFEAEVETVRYDSNTGYILLGNADGSLTSYWDISFFNAKNAKAMKKITIAGKEHYLIANNNAPLALFTKS